MGLVVAVYLFVLLGSMTLNGWLLLRHPDSFALGTLPRRKALLLALLYGLLVVWIVLLALGIVGVPGFLFGAALAALSIVTASTQLRDDSMALLVSRSRRSGCPFRLALSGSPTL